MAQTSLKAQENSAGNPYIDKPSLVFTLAPRQPQEKEEKKISYIFLLPAPLHLSLINLCMVLMLMKLAD